MKKLLAIVGMGEGNGLAIARRFAKEGYAIAMLARNETKLNEFKNSLQREGYEAHYFTADASNEASLKSALASVKNIANLEVLVYNAAVPKMVNVLNETFESLINDFQVNVAGALVAVQSVLPGMRQQEKGTILLTGGGFALYPSPDFASLSIGKAGIRSLAKILSDALKNEGIRVGTITICGTVNASDPKYNPESIAENYWNFHANPESESEIVY
ncbi:SDR family NAD(P)-dependent oxidoreductase [Aerosakkonema funiforme]|uniref:SDR family NAD(P)-dependent oxidoreductase n=2 Tax=Oscillatoriophycideae TaxID=1301283 RepID=A0A926VM08_9CYAN|nr:SDR family NAD(P)-dependent oxidoreductase [Aerosakkonema funiforme]MBD2186407.1 SDR family NAD(P)-dependent oxidoreductase [Aerosakkonema funiforme FACHB-1375]